MSERTNNNGKETTTLRVNPGYGQYQIARALVTAEQHQDSETRKRAWEKIEKWVKVLNGAFDGTLDAGSRVPVRDTPAWVTLEVLTGGFATGEFLAGGALREHEHALLAGLPPVSDDEARRVLNLHFLTEEGLATLHGLLKSGRYEVNVPEEGALLVAAWLVLNGYSVEALELLDTLDPWFPQLRFFPIPTDRPRQIGARVFVQDVAATVRSLNGINSKRQILAQREAIHIWAPFYDRMIALMLETVTGDPPRMQTGPDGAWLRLEDGRFVVEGGWPCKQYPDGWVDRVTELLAEYARLRASHYLCGRPERSKDSFAQLRGYLARCVENPASLSGRDVGRIRLILARHITRQDVPGSSPSIAFRARQAEQASGPTFKELAKVLVRRLEPFPMNEGIDDIGTIVQPLSTEEGEQWKMDAGITIPAYLQRKIERCRNDTVAVLVEQGLITSGEVLAKVLPRITSEIRAAGISDASLRQLYTAIYIAFRRRRSLLLLNLEKQIQIEELPWVKAIERFRNNNFSVAEQARETLKEVVLLAITSFPHAILPNKLLQELRALAKTAELDLPVVEEVAVDIFMGAFSDKFLFAAERASLLLENSLYATYYGIDYQQIRKLAEAVRSGNSGIRKFLKSNRIDDSFFKMCEARAGVTYQWNPAINGMIVEQQQILTTQNLAVFFGEFGLAQVLSHGLSDMAWQCFTWLCDRQQIKTDGWHARLIQVKNSAYAWRQMMFFLSLIPKPDAEEFLDKAEEHFSRQKAEFQTRFRPAMNGLAIAMRGDSLDSDMARQAGARRFLGWSKERHWLLSSDQ